LDPYASPGIMAPEDVGGTAVSGRWCPECGARCAQNHAFCTQCGAPLDAEDDGDTVGGLLYAFLDFFPGLVRPVVLVCSGLVLLLSIVVAWLGLLVFSLGAVFAGLSMIGFGLMMYTTAFIWVMYGYVCLPAEALTEFDGAKWMVVFLIAIAPVVYLFISLRPR
jgi:hypothetical protein